MATLLLASEIETISEPKPERSLCYEDGDVIISLRPNEPGNDLLLHSSILKKASPFFIPGGAKTQETWDEQNSAVLKHPSTGHDVRVYRYYLTIGDEDDVVALNTKWGEYSYPPHYNKYNLMKQFYLSENAHGFMPRIRDSTSEWFETIYPAGQVEHRAIFALLYGVKFDMGVKFDLDQVTYTSIANIIAYTVMYNLLELIAPALRIHLLKRPGVWDDIQKNVRFHLSIALKLRCKETYCEAMRHFIGSGETLSTLKLLDLPAETILQTAIARGNLQHEVNELTKKLQSLNLATYVPRANSEHPGEPVKTTYLASAFPAERNAHTQAKDIACRIYMEWLNQQLCGKEHWSHVRRNNGSYSYKNGNFKPSSLRNVCNLAIQASQTGSEMKLFDPNAAAAFVKRERFTRRYEIYMTHFIEDELKRIVREVSTLSLPMTAGPDFRPTVQCATDMLESQEGWYVPDSSAIEGLVFQKVGTTAKDDSKCHYFTCVDVDEENMPWKEDWKPFRIEWLEPASAEWLKTLGL